ncbi:gamma-glutamylcyclotransferase [Rhodovulum sp.]|uniref:gamma-glutamylcyclotransferase n=1 Tax=Rhodovulum sp. TaxID=34009 RepID=UPI001802571E|nr:gamma-glutamylcyclotransferase [Rhodovulum sp.]HDR28108.1 gamma-glutamylcyclotransferase [Rhodovulum sp.]
MRGGLWVFGYGSLLWKPGFPVAERRLARLDGWHRSFCMRSIHHRGTEIDPGLVLALDAAPGASCHGVVLRAEPGTETATLAYLRERELISSAYFETELDVVFQDGSDGLTSTAYVIDPDHVQYCGGLPLEEQAQIIARARGGMGPNDEYLFNTVDHLTELGIEDADLTWLAQRVRSLKA